MEAEEQPCIARLDVAHPSLGRAGQLPSSLSESVWHDLDRQIAAFAARQEDSKRLVESMAQEQKSFIMDLHCFVKDQVRGRSPCAERQAGRPSWQSREQPAKDLERVQSPGVEQARVRSPSSEPSKDCISVCDVSIHRPPLRLQADEHRDPSSQSSVRALGSNAKEFTGLSERSAKRRGLGWNLFGTSARDSEGDRSTSPKRGWRDATSQPLWLPTVSLSHYNNEVSVTASIVEPVHIPSIKNGLRAWWHGVAAWLLAWRFFEPFMGIVIALNSANIGWSINRELLGEPTGVQEVIEGVFLCIFVLEIALRFYVEGPRCLRSGANAFDFVLVVITAVTQIAKPLLGLVRSGSVARYLEQLIILRMMRLLRLARAVRLVASFNSLWRLVQGIMHCFSTMVSALVLIFICIYIFACFGAEFISKPFMGDREVGEIIDRQFSTLPQILLTLFQFVSMDSTAAIYVPLIQHSPALSLYFLPLLVVVAIALMNLITALIVEDAISNSRMDEEMSAFYTRRKLKVLTPALRQLFRSLDKSGDGLIEVQEVVQSIKQGVHIPPELQELLSPARMIDLFEALDSDHSGDLSESEFVNGMGCVAFADVSLETIQILHHLRSLREDLRQVRQTMSPGTGARTSRKSDKSKGGSRGVRQVWDDCTEGPEGNRIIREDCAEGTEGSGVILSF